MMLHQIISIIKLFEDPSNIFDFLRLCVSLRGSVHNTSPAYQEIPLRIWNWEPETIPRAWQYQGHLILFIYHFFSFTIKKAQYPFFPVFLSQTFVMVWIIVQQILITLALLLWAEQTSLPCWYWAWKVSTRDTGRGLEYAHMVWLGFATPGIHHEKKMARWLLIRRMWKLHVAHLIPNWILEPSQAELQLTSKLMNYKQNLDVSSH